MPVHVIAVVTIDENEPRALAHYLETTAPLLAKAGARIMSRFEAVDTLVGPRWPRTIMIVEYPSLEAVNSVFQSEQYLSLAPIRDKAFSSYEVHIAEAS